MLHGSQLPAVSAAMTRVKGWSAFSGDFDVEVPGRVDESLAFDLCPDGCDGVNEQSATVEDVPGWGPIGRIKATFHLHPTPNGAPQ